MHSERISRVPSRREILLGGASCLLAGAQRPPALRFLQINDLHYTGPSSKGGYKDGNQRIDWLFTQIRDRTFFPKLDFIIVLGDFVHGGNIECIREEMPVMHEKLQGLGVPYYTVVGNHENWQSEGDDQFEKPYREAFGAERLSYSFVQGGVEFVLLNNSGSATKRPPEVFAQRRQMLEALLSARPTLPKILCCHIPLVSVREEAVLKTSFGFRSYRTMEPEVLEIVEAESSRVRTVLSGHLHLTGAVKRGGIQHVSISGTASYPHDVALYSVFPDRIEAEVIRLPSHLLVPETNIHGSKRHQRDFTDETHLDYTSYLLGTTVERRWSVPLGRG